MRTKLFHSIQWKTVLKDIAKFYGYLALLYSFAFLLVWGHAHWSLEAQKIDLDEMNSDPLLTDLKSFDLEDYKFLAKQMTKYMFILVCFGVFFTIPPKNFNYVLVVTLLISLTANMPFFFDTVMAWLQANFYLCSSVLFAWLCSHAWYRYRSKAHIRSFDENS